MIKFLGNDRNCTKCRYLDVASAHYPCNECTNFSKFQSYKWKEEAMEKGIQTFLDSLPDKERTKEGRAETSARYVHALSELTRGYQEDIPSLFKVFNDIPEEQMVIVGDISFTSLCEHHILPFHGKAYIGYIPVKGRVVGISKLARVFYAHARRLQVQERIGHDVVADIMQYLQPSGAICVIKAQHLCMTSRGVRAEEAVTVTSAFQGSFEKLVVRQEFFQLAGI